MIMLNKIGDDAAEEMLAFYQSHLSQGVSGAGKYEAHFTLALLTWRKHRQTALDTIVAHFRAAAKVAIDIICARELKNNRGREDLFNFMFPLFVIYIFGEKPQRKILAGVKRAQWAPSEDAEFQSLTELFDLLRKKAINRDFSETEILQIAQVNEKFITHPFYQPWIKAFTQCLTGILNCDEENVARAIEALIELHDEEAYDGEWSKTPEGLMGFWPLAAKITAEAKGIQVKIQSDYLPEMPPEYLQ